MPKSFYSTLAFLLLACSGDKDSADGITNPEAFDVDQDGFQKQMVIAMTSITPLIQMQLTFQITESMRTVMVKMLHHPTVMSTMMAMVSLSKMVIVMMPMIVSILMTDVPDNGIDEDCDGEDATTASSVLISKKSNWEC